MVEVFTSLYKKYTLSSIKNIVNIEASNQQKWDYSCSCSLSPYEIIKKDNHYNINSGTSQANIIFSFLNLKLAINSYAIESTMNNNSGCTWSYPISWHLDGSDDKNKWETIDTVSSNYSLDDRGKLKWFNLPNFVTFKYYRFVSTAVNAPGRWLGISEFEFKGYFGFFGCLNENKACSCNKRVSFTTHLLVLIINLCYI